MIVTCEQCQTRFKIPDDKVSAKGVKVRCTKCQHTFRVARPAPVAAEDPFGLFGSPMDPPPAAPPAAPRSPEVTSTGGLDALFSDAAPSPAPPPPASPEPDMGLMAESEPDRSFFEMPAPAPSAAPPAASGGLLAEIPDLAPPPEPEGTRAPRRPVTAPSMPAPEPTLEESAPAPIRWGVRLVRTLAAAALLAVLGGAAVVVVNGGSLPRPGAISARAEGNMVAEQVLSSLYETQNGKAVLFVRGQVQNRTNRPERLRVRVELWDGNQAVRTSQGLAGAVATPEDLYRLTSVADAEALRTRLDAGARPLPAGSQAPFLVAFYDFPAEVGGLAVRVNVAPERVQAARAGP